MFVEGSGEIENTEEHLSLQKVCEWRPSDAHLVRGEPLFLEQSDVHIIVDALEKQFALIGNQLPLLGCLQGAHQSLEDVGAAVVVEQHPELHGGSTISVCERERPKRGSRTLTGLGCRRV